MNKGHVFGRRRDGLDSLSDRLLGVTLIGSILTLLFWAYLHFMRFPKIPLKASLAELFIPVCWIAFIACILSDFLFTLKKFQATANSALIEAMMEAMMKDRNNKEIENQEESNNDLKIYFAR